MFASAQVAVFFVFAVGAFAFEVWALIDALRYPAGSFTAAGKQSKQLWGVVLAVAAAVGFLGLPGPIGLALTNPLGLLSLAGIAAAGIYTANVRPALRATGRGRRTAPVSSSPAPAGGKKEQGQKETA